MFAIRRKAATRYWGCRPVLHFGVSCTACTVLHGPDLSPGSYPALFCSLLSYPVLIPTPCNYPLLIHSSDSYPVPAYPPGTILPRYLIMSLTIPRSNYLQFFIVSLCSYLVLTPSPCNYPLLIRPTNYPVLVHPSGAILTRYVLLAALYWPPTLTICPLNIRPSLIHLRNNINTALQLSVTSFLAICPVISSCISVGVSYIDSSMLEPDLSS